MLKLKKNKNIYTWKSLYFTHEFHHGVFVYFLWAKHFFGENYPLLFPLL